MHKSQFFRPESIRALIGAVVVLAAVVAVAMLSKTTSDNLFGFNQLNPGIVRNTMEQVKGWTALAEQDTHPAVALSHNAHAAATLRMLRRLVGDRAVAKAGGIYPGPFADALEEQQRGIFTAIGSACPPLQIPTRFVVAAFPDDE